METKNIVNIVFNVNGNNNSFIGNGFGNNNSGNNISIGNAGGIEVFVKLIDHYRNQCNVLTNEIESLLNQISVLVEENKKLNLLANYNDH